MASENKLTIPQLRRIRTLVEPLNGTWDLVRENIDYMLSDLIAEDSELNKQLSNNLKEVAVTKGKLARIWADETKES